MKYILLLAIFYAITSLGDFLLTNQAPASIQKAVQSRVESVVRFYVPGDGGCTGTVVSPDGHILTAMHCFTNCMKSNRAFLPKQLFEGKPFWIALVRPNSKSQCSMYYKETDGYDESEKFDFVQIVASGKGVILFNQNVVETSSLVDFYVNAGPGVLQELRDDGVGRLISDFVVFKSEAFKGRKFVRLKEHPFTRPQLSQKELFSLSYPTYTLERQTGVATDGRSMYLSLGRFNENGLFDGVSEALDRQKQRYSEDQVREAYSYKDYLLWASTESIAGTSGSPIFDSEGSLLGMTIYNHCDRVKARKGLCKNVSGVLNINRVVEQLRTQVPQLF